MLQVCNYGKGGTNAGGRGDGGMTLEEYRASYSIWAVFASPIIISADLRTLAQEHPACLAMLKNEELLAISQDSLARAVRIARPLPASLHACLLLRMRACGWGGQLHLLSRATVHELY